MNNFTKMKLSMFTLLLFVGSGVVCGQTTIFTETMGTVSATTTIAAHETNDGFNNDGYTMSGTADLRNTTISTGYTNASASANVFFTSTVGIYLMIEGINTTNYTDLTLSLGHYKKHNYWK
jgi:hypothetical protein